MTARLRLHVIACPSLRPELEALAAGCTTEIAFHHLERTLHERTAEALRDALQNAIDQTADCDGIAIAYGLCNRGVIGLTARTIPLVIPRAHDCIGILLGSSRRYLNELDREPGTYFQSAGWLGAARHEHQPEFTFGPNSNVSLERLAARYGEEDAAYLLAEFEGFTRHYKRLAYIATANPAEPALEAEARAIATRCAMDYQRLEGDTGWLRRLLEGAWNGDEFLVVPPGQSVVRASGERLIEAAPCEVP